MPQRGLPRFFTPASRVQELNINIVAIKGIYNDNTHQHVVAVDRNGGHHVVNCKALAKQNLDVSLSLVYFSSLTKVYHVFSSSLITS